MAAGAPSQGGRQLDRRRSVRGFKERGRTWPTFARTFPPSRLAALVDLVAGGTLSSKLGRELFAVMRTEPGDPAALAKAHGLVQESDAGALAAIAERVLEANAGVVDDFLAGKEKALELPRRPAHEGDEGQGAATSGPGGSESRPWTAAGPRPGLERRESVAARGRP